MSIFHNTRTLLLGLALMQMKHIYNTNIQLLISHDNNKMSRCRLRRKIKQV